MKLELVSWNGTNINASPFKSYIVSGQLANIAVNPVTTNRADDYPALSSVVKLPSVIVIGIIVAAGQNINTNRELLKKYFFSDESKHNLIAKDTADSDRQWYRSGIPTRLIEAQNAPNEFFVTIQTDYPYWQLVTATSDTWAVTSSGDTAAISNIGNLPVKPVFTITPTTTKTGGLTYRRYIPIYNNMDKAISVPLDITDGGLDTATLTPSKMQTSGDDFRVWMNSGEIYRWLNGMDGATTKCWCNIPLSPRLEGTTSVQIGSAATAMTFAQTPANLTFLQNLSTRTNRTLLVESEAVVYDPANISLLTYSISSVTRAQKGTTATTHAASSTVRHIEQDLWIMYGDSTLDAPEVDDDLKPIFDLSSTNEAWAYTNYFDDGLSRPGAWKGEVLASRTKLSYVFTASHNTFVDPSTVLGLAERASQDFTVPHESASMHWLFSHPAGVNNVLYSGEKYRTGSWPGIVGLQYLQANAVWFTAYNEAQPATTGAWEAFGPRNQSLGGTFGAVRFAIDGVLSSTINEQAMAEFDTVTVSFTTANLPTISVGSELSINFFDLKITNSTTGEWIKAKAPCPVNSPLVIDCANKSAYLSDGRTVPITLSSDRVDWLNLSPGSNTLEWTDVGTVAVTVAVSHRDRTL